MARGGVAEAYPAERKDIDVTGSFLDGMILTGGGTRMLVWLVQACKVGTRRG